MPQRLSTLRTGDSIPSNTIGTDGDTFINTASNTTYVRTAGVYTTVAQGLSAKQYASSGNFAYCGTAPAGSLQASAVWSITRLTIDSSGTVTATACATNVAWTNYLSVTYTTCT